MPVMCLELQKIRHFRCLPLSFGTWSFSINLLSADSRVLFSDGKPLPFLLPLFLLRFRIIQRVFMLRNKSFTVYCTVLIAIITVQDIKEPWLCVV
jgi:hypothetical protein